MAQRLGATNIGSARMSSVVYHFCSENRLSKILFSNPFPKNALIVNLKNRDLDLTRKFHPESGYYGFKNILNGMRPTCAAS